MENFFVMLLWLTAADVQIMQDGLKTITYETREECESQYFEMLDDLDLSRYSLGLSNADISYSRLEDSIYTGHNILRVYGPDRIFDHDVLKFYYTCEEIRF